MSGTHVNRLLAVVLAAVLVATGCGDDDGGDGLPAASTVPDGAGGTPAPPESGTSAPVATSAPPSGDAGTTTVPEATPDVDGGPGTGAPWFLRPQPATSIVLEVSSESGAEPRQETIDHLASVLGTVSGKPVSVTGGGPLPAHETWTASDVREAAAAAAITEHGPSAVIRLLFVHGSYAESDEVLGVAVRADVAAIFADRVDAAASPIVGSRAIEAAVTTHEVGHLLGLVDIHLDTGRDDPEHPGHSTNHDSVMYWAVESTLVTDLLTGGPPRDFDDADLADLAAIRAGA